MTTQSKSESQTYLTFCIQGEHYAIAVTQVTEVLPMMWINRVPEAPSFLEGTLYLRGELLPVIDLTKRLKLARQSYKQNTRLVVVTLPQRKVGVIIDQVEGLQEIRAQHHQKGILHPEHAPLVGEVFFYKSSPFQILQLEHLLTSQEEKQLAEIPT